MTKTCKTCGLIEGDHNRIYCKYCGAKVLEDHKGDYYPCPSCSGNHTRQSEVKVKSRSHDTAENFDLSKLDCANIMGKQVGASIYRGEDVKTFIKKLKEAITHNDGTPCTMVPEIIDKLAGEELSGR